MLKFQNNTEFNALKGIKISDSKYALNKTVTVISASQKSGFPITTSAALYFAYNLLSTITTNYISYLLKTREIYIFPLINVDAYAWTETQFRRGKGFLVYETNKNNTKCNNFDGNGVNLNRNWGFKWNATEVSSLDACNTTYPGTQAFSEIETNTIAKILYNLNVVAWVHYENIGNLYMKPYTYLSTLQNYSSYENYAYKAIENMLSNDYKMGTSQQLFGFIEDGSLIDWAKSQGAISLQAGIGQSFLNSSKMIPELDSQFSIALNILELSGYYITLNATNMTYFDCENNCTCIDSNFEVLFDYYVINTGLANAYHMSLIISLVYNLTSSLDLVIENFTVKSQSLYENESYEQVFTNKQDFNSLSYYVEDFFIHKASVNLFSLKVSGMNKNNYYGPVEVFVIFNLLNNKYSDIGFSTADFFQFFVSDKVYDQNLSYRLPLIITFSILGFVAIAILSVLLIFKKKKETPVTFKLPRELQSLATNSSPKNDKI